jgi:hypothetical protein
VSSLVLDFVLLRWYRRLLSWMYEQLIRLLKMLSRIIFLVTSKVRLVQLWLDHYISPEDTITMYTPWRLRLTIIPSSSAMAHGVIAGYGVPVNS